MDGGRHLHVLGQALRVPGVKHVFVGTGVRHDVVLEDSCKDYLGELCRRHVGGHLKVAPEHIAQPVLDCMRKSKAETFEIFRDRFAAAARRSGKELYLVPYFMSGHPACTVENMVKLAGYLHRFGCFVEQVQDFIPLPMTLSGCIYWTGIDPLAGREVHSARGAEKNLQRTLLQPSDPRNRKRLEPLLRKLKKTYLLSRPVRTRPETRSGPVRARRPERQGA